MSIVVFVDYPESNVYLLKKLRIQVKLSCKCVSLCLQLHQLSRVEIAQHCSHVKSDVQMGLRLTKQN